MWKAIATCLLSAAACSCGTGGGAPALVAGAPTLLSDPPRSAATPIPYAHGVFSPPEARERPQGQLAFVVDSGDSAVYELDAGRARFLGPAPAVQGTALRVLPGYPTVFAEQGAPQGAAIVQDALFVAGGASGLVYRMRIAPSGLENADAFRVTPGLAAPTVQPNGGIRQRPVDDFLTRISQLGTDRIAVSDEGVISNTLSIFALDSSTGQVAARAEIAKGGHLAGMAWIQGRQGLVLALASQPSSELVFLDHSLAVTRRIALTFQPRGLVVDAAGRLWLSGVEAGQAVLDVFDAQYDLPRQVDRGPSSSVGGPLVASGGGIFWTILGHNVVRAYRDGEAPALASYHVCGSVEDLAVLQRYLLVVCHPSAITMVDLVDARVVTRQTGAFFFRVVAVSPS
jgi:hypothetical protein